MLNSDQFEDPFAAAIARGKERQKLEKLIPPDVHEINKAIDSYPARTVSAGEHEAAPYNAESLARIYEPRVRELFDLQSQGFTHAAWKWDDERKENRWHGVTPPSGES